MFAGERVRGARRETSMPYRDLRQFLDAMPPAPEFDQWR
jgi:hypothetical protein